VIAPQGPRRFTDADLFKRWQDNDTEEVIRAGLAAR
jgi:hypothetical protein